MSHLNDLKGQTFGYLTAERYLGARRWECKCICGRSITVYTHNLTSGHTTSCGCQKVKAPKKIGKKQGHLLIQDSFRKGGRTYYKCLCDCGRETIIRADSYSLSCGKCDAFADKRKQAVLESGEYYEGTQISKLRCKPTIANKSGIVGVNWYKRTNQWQAGIRFKGKRYNLGLYDKIEDAAAVRRKAENALFTDFLEWYEEYKKQKIEENKKTVE